MRLFSSRTTVSSHSLPRRESRRMAVLDCDIASAVGIHESILDDSLRVDRRHAGVCLLSSELWHQERRGNVSERRLSGEPIN